MEIEDLISALEMAEINLKEAESDYDRVVKERDEALDKLAAMETQKLDSPARVNHTVFGKGVNWSTVIGAAQRYYKHMLEPQPDAEKIAVAQKIMRELTDQWWGRSGSAVAAPDGWKLMPEQITEEMADAYWSEYQKDVGSHLVRCYGALYEAAPSHSQQSAECVLNPDPTNVWERCFADAAKSVLVCHQSNTGYEPSVSVLARSIDEIRSILDDANVYFPGAPYRCPSHESEQQ